MVSEASQDDSCLLLLCLSMLIVSVYLKFTDLYPLTCVCTFHLPHTRQSPGVPDVLIVSMCLGSVPESLTRRSAGFFWPVNTYLSWVDLWCILPLQVLYRLCWFLCSLLDEDFSTSSIGTKYSKMILPANIQPLCKTCYVPVTDALVRPSLIIVMQRRKWGPYEHLCSDCCRFQP